MAHGVKIEPAFCKQLEESFNTGARLSFALELTVCKTQHSRRFLCKLKIPWRHNEI